MKRVFIGILITCLAFFIFSIVTYAIEAGATQTASKFIHGYLKEWGTLLSILATVLLAFAAFWVISDTRHFRYLDDKTKTIAELNEWAANVIRNLSIPMRQSVNSTQLKKNLMDCRAELVISVAQSIRVFATVRKLLAHGRIDKQLELNQAIDHADAELRAYIDRLFQFDIDTAEASDVEEITDSVANLTATMKDLLETTSQI